MPLTVLIIAMTWLTIHYNCVGLIEIPEVLSLPEPDVMIQTRKGVAVSYSQAQIAI
jgi:hypothetical protein